MTRRSVDLPHPLGPTMATTSRSRTRRSSPSRATRRVPVISKLRLTPRSSMASVDATSCPGPSGVERRRRTRPDVPVCAPRATDADSFVGGRLSPSSIRTVTVGSLRRIDRRAERRLVGWQRTILARLPTTGRGLHPTPKVRRAMASCDSTIAVGPGSTGEAMVTMRRARWAACTSRASGASLPRNDAPTHPSRHPRRRAGRPRRRRLQRTSGCRVPIPA